MSDPAVLDTTVFSLASMLSPAPALDIFGDSERRRCTPDEGDDDTKDLFDLHLRVAIIYAAGYTAIQAMPYCREMTALMEQRGHPLSLLAAGNQTMDTPWGMGMYVCSCLLCCFGASIISPLKISRVG